MDEAALGAWLAAATRSVDRVQAQPYYADDAELFRRWAAGEPGPDMGPISAWHDYLAADKDRGVTWRQLLIVRTPLSVYWRAAMEWGFASHTAYEQIRVSESARQHLRPDFYIRDGQDVAVMRYTGGAFKGAVAQDEYRTSYLDTWNLQWEIGEDFQAWWDRHPQYRRGSRRAA